VRALRGAIPRALRDHRSAAGVQYGAYARAVVARLGPLPADSRPWLKAAGRLVLDLDALAAEQDAARAVLSNGAGRRARDRARVQLRQLERRSARLRGQLADAEARLAALAAARPPASVDAIAAASRRLRGEA
jgi:hypothetical protein